MTVTDATFAGTLPAIQRTQDHRYIYQGVTYPGVTSVLKVLDKSGALMTWAARETAEAAVSLAESRQIFDMMMATTGRDGIIKAVTARANWKRDEAAQLGTSIHSWADRYVNMGELPAVSETAAEYTRHYAEWWQRSGWKLRISEAAIVAPADEGAAHTGWGGTLDLLCYDEAGRTVLADIKTGKGVYRETILQLAAYGMGRFISPLGSQDVYEMPRVDRYVVIHVTREGVRPVELAVGPNEWSAWISALDLWNWTELVKGVRL